MMNVYEVKSIGERLEGNTYPGRGIILGKSADGKCAVAAYFIMGRSANSRNRVFAERDGAVLTEPFDASRVEDPRLIIYSAIRKCGSNLIVTNGDQTDTIYKGLISGMTFEEALSERCFEPDAPNFTPRISGMITFGNGKFSYKMSILKSGDENGSVCNRFFFHYLPKRGVGHFLHTYVCDGDPIPSFQGEPERVSVPSDIDEFTREVWNALDKDNRISLYVRYVNQTTGEEENRMVNRNQ